MIGIMLLGLLVFKGRGIVLYEYDNWYWVEVSGVIEHLFKKNKGKQKLNGVHRK